VQKVTFISKDTSWEELKKEIDVPDITNPLPNTLHVKLDDTKNISSVMQDLKQIDGVNDTSYAKDLVQKFEMINAACHYPQNDENYIIGGVCQCKGWAPAKRQVYCEKACCYRQGAGNDICCIIMLQYKIEYNCHGNR
ncbi:MAG: permease-like cell division protein FtsX, partial [Clostridia bacterium]|nr:permease-like cell division protein FtsX [Clostridia bacterium]